jgi:hypothetical protein
MKRILMLATLLCVLGGTQLSAQVVLGNGIDYGGGPTMYQHRVYLIWYGNWTGNTALTILPDLIIGFDHSAYMNTMTTYADGFSGVNLSDNWPLQGQAFAYYTHGTSLDDTAIKAIVNDAVNGGGLFPDATGIYLVLTSADVDVHRGGVLGFFTQYFCKDFCGYHNKTHIDNWDISYASIGNPDRCANTCGNTATGPNGNGGADIMASVIAHELAETITDPDVSTGWNRNSAGTGFGEVGDLCEPPFFYNTYISVFSAPNGTIANVQLGNRDFLLQSLYVNANGGYCALNFGTPPAPNPPPTTNMFRWLGANGLHYVLNTQTQGPAGATGEGNLGIMSLGSQSGMHPLFSCVFSSNTAYQFVSQDINCEGQLSGGLEGYAFDVQQTNTQAIYRCRVGSNGDHFVSLDSGCEGQIDEGLLGYLTIPPPPPPTPTSSSTTTSSTTSTPALHGAQLPASGIESERRVPCGAALLPNPPRM